MQESEINGYCIMKCVRFNEIYSYFSLIRGVGMYEIKYICKPISNKLLDIPVMMKQKINFHSMPGDLCTARSIISLSPLLLSDRRNLQDPRGKWPLDRNPERSW